MIKRTAQLLQCVECGVGLVEGADLYRVLMGVQNRIGRKTGTFREVPEFGPFLKWKPVATFSFTGSKLGPWSMTARRLSAVHPGEHI
jgi:hypothetical protein